MKRGDIYAVVGKGDFSGKPRPALIVQSDAFNGHHASITVCPITSVLTGQFLIRLAIPAGPGTGLEHDSEIQIDKLQSVKLASARKLIGAAPDEVMLVVDEALRRWLQL